MKKVDSDALGLVTKALGLTGSGAPETELIDGIVEQSLNVAPIVRRGRTLQPSEGIFYGVFENVHPGGDTQSSLLNPLRPELLLRHAPYPAVVPPQFDLWLLYAWVNRVAGTGDVTAALDGALGTGLQGWGVDDATLPVTQGVRVPYAIWNGSIDIISPVGILGAENQAVVKLGYRFPRQGSPDLRFRSNSTAASTWQCTVVTGLFPVSLGQDAIVGV